MSGREAHATHDELRELLGAYSVDALTDAERAAVDEHLASCAVCRRVVADHAENGPGALC